MVTATEIAVIWDELAGPTLRKEQQAAAPEFTLVKLFFPGHYFQTLPPAEMREGMVWFIRVCEKYMRVCRLYNRLVNKISPFLPLWSPPERAVVLRMTAHLGEQIKHFESPPFEWQMNRFDEVAPFPPYIVSYIAVQAVEEYRRQEAEIRRAATRRPAGTAPAA